MAAESRYWVWLSAAPAPGRQTFALLYALESFARASVASVIPIQAYDLLRDEQQVSILYTTIACAGLGVTLLMPMLIGRFARRWVYTAGVVSIALGSLLFLTQSLAGQMGGMFLRVAGASALSITLNLYIMDHIRRTEFIRAESLRMALSTFGWTVGPTLGVILYSRFGIVAPHAVVLLFCTVLLGFFWYFRLGDNPVIRPGATRAASPLANIGRFVRQPRLRLAWVIAFGRSCYWTTLFVYGPILMVVTGQGGIAGGLLVSGANLLLLSAVWWGRLADRVGARPVMAGCFAAMSVILLAVGAAGEAAPLAAGGLLLLAAFFCISLDAVGSAAFMRAVRPWERPQMAAVYRTYLDFSDLLPPLVYAVVLGFTGLGGVFATLGVFMAVCAWLTWRYLPKSM